MPPLTKDQLKAMEPSALDAHILELVDAAIISGDEKLLEKKDKIASSLRTSLKRAFDMKEDININLEEMVQRKIDDELLEFAYNEYVEFMKKIGTRKNKIRSPRDFRMIQETQIMSTYAKWQIIKRKKLKIGDEVILTVKGNIRVKIVGFTPNCDVQVKELNGDHILVRENIVKHENGPDTYLDSKTMYTRDGKRVAVNRGDMANENLGGIVYSESPNLVRKI